MPCSHAAHRDAYCFGATLHPRVADVQRRGARATLAVLSVRKHRWVKIPRSARALATERPSEGSMKITLKVNGQARAIEADPDMPLLWALRDFLGLKGAKYGCGIGACGACTVQVNGRAMRSCAVPLKARGRGRDPHHRGARRRAPGAARLARGAGAAVRLLPVRARSCRPWRCSSRTPRPTAAQIRAGHERRAVPLRHLSAHRGGGAPRGRRAWRRRRRADHAHATRLRARLGCARHRGVGAAAYARRPRAAEMRTRSSRRTSRWPRTAASRCIRPTTEMGQGTHTGHAVIIADELGVDIERVSVVTAEPADPFRRNGQMGSGGSWGVRYWYQPLRKAAAQAREVLIGAGGRAVGRAGRPSARSSAARSCTRHRSVGRASARWPPPRPRCRCRRSPRCARSPNCATRAARCRAWICRPRCAASRCSPRTSNVPAWCTPARGSRRCSAPNSTASIATRQSRCRACSTWSPSRAAPRSSRANSWAALRGAESLRIRFKPTPHDRARLGDHLAPDARRPRRRRRSRSTRARTATGPRPQGAQRAWSRPTTRCRTCRHAPMEPWNCTVEFDADGTRAHLGAGADAGPQPQRRRGCGRRAAREGAPAHDAARRRFRPAPGLGRDRRGGRHRAGDQAPGKVLLAPRGRVRAGLVSPGAGRATARRRSMPTAA